MYSVTRQDRVEAYNGSYLTPPDSRTTPHSFEMQALHSNENTPLRPPRNMALATRPPKRLSLATKLRVALATQRSQAKAVIEEEEDAEWDGVVDEADDR